MTNGMDLDLTKFINSNLPWKGVKKGRRSARRRPTKPANGSVKLGVVLGNNFSKTVQDSSIFEYERLGVAVLGQHFAENVGNIPIKKRRLLCQSQSPPPQTPYLNHEGCLSPQPLTSSSYQEESEQHVDSKCASGHWGGCDSYPNGVKSKFSELTTKELCCSEDFSGIALLAAAACDSSINDSDDHLESSGVEQLASSGVEQLATLEGVGLFIADIKETVASLESASSLVQHNVLPVLQRHHHDNGVNGVERDVPSKEVRLHWDLNKAVEEWQEPCDDLPVGSQGHDFEGIIGGDLQCENLNLEGCEARECKTIVSDVEISASKLDGVDLFLTPAKCEDVLASPTSILGERADINCDSRGQVIDKACSTDITMHDFPVTAAPEKLIPRCSGQPVSENPHSECRSSEVFQDEQRQLAGGDGMIKVQEGYNSPIEDGELREPIVYAWVENEVDRDQECVDFEFDNDYKDDFNTSVLFMSEKIEVSHEDSQTMEKTNSLVEKGVDAVCSNTVDEYADNLKKPSSSVSSKTSGRYQSREHYEDVSLDGNDTSSRKFRTESKNEHDEIRALRGSMMQTEGSSSFNIFHGSRSDDFGDTGSQAEREFGSENYMGRGRSFYRGRGRIEVDGRWIDSTVGVRDSRNHYGHSRPRIFIGDSAVKSSGLDSHDDGQSRSYVPRGMYRPLNRRQSPTGRDDSYGRHRGMLPMQGFSHETSRGRPGFIPQGFRRGGPQEEYHERGPYYVDRKGRGFSPNFSRESRMSLPCRRSRSRSRSRSPTAWHMHRGRTVGARRQTPDFRSEGRVQGDRFAFQKPGFSSDFEEGFVFPPRGRRMSPKHNSRCFDDQKCMDGQYRDRRSSPPVRMFGRNPRFDSGDYPGRFKSDDHFRPMTRSVRFPQNHGSGRGYSYDDSSDDRRKPKERFDMNRGRRYVAGTGERRFRYDTEDGFEPRNTRNEDDCLRSAVKRGDVPVNIGEQRGHSRYNSYMNFSAIASSTGERDYEGDSAPKEV